MYLNNPADVQGRAGWWGGWNLVAGTCRRAVREPGHRHVVRLPVLRRAGRVTLRSRSTPRGRAPAERLSVGPTRTDTRGAKGVLPWRGGSWVTARVKRAASLQQRRTPTHVNPDGSHSPHLEDPCAKPNLNFQRSHLSLSVYRWSH